MEVDVLELRLTPGRVAQVRSFLDKLGEGVTFVVRLTSDGEQVDFLAQKEPQIER